MRYLVAFILIFYGLSYSFGQNAYTNHTELGTLSYGLFPGQVGLSIRTFNGVELNRNYTVGLTVGLDKFRVEDELDFWSLPLSAQGRYNLHSERKVSFYGSLDMGYGLGVLNKEKRTENDYQIYKGGFLWNPQVGIKINSNRESMYFSFSVGYKYHRIGTKYYYRPPDMESPTFGSDFLSGYRSVWEKNYDLHRLSFMFGIGF